MVEKHENKSLKATLIFACLVIGLVSIVSIMKFKSGEINYLNSDATWHALYTIKCYDETPISQHKFLPIVSLGRTEDKNISWGASIPDSSGNYYYTSFSPAFFTLGYIFIKLFHLGYTESSLYILNSILFAVSALILAAFLSDLFRKSKYRNAIVITGIILYILQPELLQGMGIVYWAQSLFQVTLIAQIYAYYRWKEYSSKKTFIVFVILGIANPYIEWTGYVANFGFALSELILRWRDDRFKAIVRAEETMLLGVVSFILFCLHYCSTVEPAVFFEALKARFLARNFTTSVSLKSLIPGYGHSFQYTWILLVVILLIYLAFRFIPRKDSISKNSSETSVLLNHKYLLVVSLIPVLENFIMKEHAVSYTYDRMKLIFPIVLVICSCVNFVLNSTPRKWIQYVCCGCAIVFGILNYHSYANDSAYRWETDYRRDNEKLAEMLSVYRNDAVYGYGGAVRGYLNMTFHTGCYEGSARIQALSFEKGKRYAIVLSSPGGAWNMYDFSGAMIYDNDTEEYTIISKSDHTFTQVKGTGFLTSSMTDSNWENGIFRNGSIVLFPRNEQMLEKLNSATKMSTDVYTANILDFESDDLWIRVTVDGDPKEFAYPAFVNIE